MSNKLVVLVGPTGIGKTALSLALAHHFSSVIVSSDARQVYREMKIGTAAPNEQQLALVPHYFIGNRSIHEYYTAGKYELEVLELLSDLFAQHQTILLVGGSGLYIDAVCNGIDAFPDADASLRENLTKQLEDEGLESLRFLLKKLDEATYHTIDLKNPQRIMRALEVSIATGKPYSEWKTGAAKKRDFDIVKIGLTCPREALYARIDSRVLQMIDAGLLDEARQLFPHRGLTALKTVGYSELFDYFDGKTDLETAVRLIQQHTRNYAKKQLSYWSRYNDITWFDVSEDRLLEKIVQTIVTE